MHPIHDWKWWASGYAAVGLLVAGTLFIASVEEDTDLGWGWVLPLCLLAFVCAIAWPFILWLMRSRPTSKRKRF